MNSFSGLQKREARISNILEDLPLGIISFDADGIIDFVNPAFIKMGNLFQLNISSLKGKNIFQQEIIPGISLSGEMNELKNGYPSEKEIKNLKTTGDSNISLIIKTSPYFVNDQFAGGILILEDLKVLSESREKEFIKIESLKKITEAFVEFFFVIDKEGSIKYSAGNKLPSLNNSYESKIQEVIPGLPDDFLNILSDVQDKTEEKRILVSIKTDSIPVPYECLISPLASKYSRFLTCTFFNISDQQRIETLENRAILFETVADVISDGIVGVNSEGTIQYWSPSALSLFGFPGEQIKGKKVWEYILGFNQQSFIELKEDLQQIHYMKKQLLFYDNSGNEIPVNGLFLLGDEDNIFISLDTASGNNEKLNFKAFEENFRNLVSNTDTVVLRLDNNGTIKYVNPAFTSQLQYNEEEAVGKNLNDFLVSKHRLEYELYKEKPFNKDLIFHSSQGGNVYFTASITPLLEDDTLTGFNVNLINQSAKKKEETDLHFFKLIFENTKEAMAVEHKGKILAANNSFGKMFGYSLGSDIINKDILDLAATNDVLKVAEYLQLYQTKKELSQPLEFTGKRKNGSNFFCELTPSSFSIEGNRYFIMIVRDVTDRKRAQQVIRESEEKYRSIIENIDDFLFTLERSKLFFSPIFFTNSVEKITGFTQAEMHKDIKLLLKIIHPDDLLNVKESMKRFSRSISKMTAEFEYRIINKQGNVVWVRNKLSVVRNDKGEVAKVYGLVSDISLRRKAEEDLQKTTQNLIKLNETKDRFISIISHDLRTPFSSILGFTDLLLNDETLSYDERNQYVKYIQESSNAMLSLVNSLLDWTRLQTGRIRFEPEKVEGSEVITKSINTLGGAAFRKNISINSIIQENLFLYIDKDLIGQVFNNLISNSIKYTREGGNITISAAPSHNSRFFEFSVKDTGIGIRHEDAKKLFGVDTKFTTEGTAGEKGTGLGLSLVKEIIEKHGGIIRVESEPGVGSNFLFTLPAAAANILLIDSNTTDRILYSKILKHITADYNIDTASNGREALSKISSSTYALIVTEHNMPVMGGYDFILALKKLDMKVKPPVIVLSNTVDRQTMDDYNEIGIHQVFQKPVNLSLFKQAVEKTLHEALK
jgi:PAS domain S-box-containing protein